MGLSEPGREAKPRTRSVVVSIVDVALFVPVLHASRMALYKKQLQTYN
jgi:hypothetical protein